MYESADKIEKEGNTHDPAEITRMFNERKDIIKQEANEMQTPKMQKFYKEVGADMDKHKGKKWTEEEAREFDGNEDERLEKDMK